MARQKEGGLPKENPANGEMHGELSAAEVALLLLNVPTLYLQPHTYEGRHDFHTTHPSHTPDQIYLSYPTRVAQNNSTKKRKRNDIHLLAENHS